MNSEIFSKYFKLFSFTLLTCLIAYGFTLSNFSLTIDSEQTFFPDTSLALGRWGTNLFRYHIFGGIIPYFTLFLGLLCYSLAAVEITKLFRLSTVQGYIFCGLLVTFPQMAYQFVFTMQADAVGFGFLLSALSMKFFLKSWQGKFNSVGVVNFIIAALLYMFAIGIYQALALLPIVLFIIIVFQSTYDEDYKFSTELKRGFLFAGYTIVSGILYIISVKILAPQADGGGYLSSYTAGNSNSLITNFFKLWRIHLEGRAYYGNKTFIAASIVSVLLLLSFMISPRKLLIRVLLLIFIMVFPFSIAFFITSGYTPPRLYVASGIVYAFLIVHLLSLVPAERIVAILASLVIVVNIYFITMLFWSQNKIYNHDINIANDIKHSIKAQYPEFDPKTDYVYFFGALPYIEHEKYRLRDSEIFGGSFFLWDGGSNDRIINFMKFTDVAEYKMIDNRDIYLKIKESVAPMPAWPKNGYVKKIDNVVIVKLGDTKGAPLWVE